jgi:hypothetical protein
MPSTDWNPTIRYQQDADELNRLGSWLIRQIDSVEGWRTHGDGSAIALDYFRLADRLAALSADVREFAATMAGPVP